MKNFMSGKKKFTMFAVTAATALINAYVADPSQAEGLTELAAQYLPTLIVFAGAIFGVNRETKVDVEREKTKQAQAETAKAEAERPHREMVEAEPPEPFDPAAFNEKVEQRAAETYLEANDMTRFFAARDLGMAAPCAYLNQAVDFSIYLLDKAHKAFICKFGYPYGEADNHLGDDKSCPYYSVDNMARQKGIDYYAMLRQLRATIRKLHDIDQLYDTDIDWYARLGGKPTLYSVGQLARELLKHPSQREG